MQPLARGRILPVASTQEFVFVCSFILRLWLNSIILCSQLTNLLINFCTCWIHVSKEDCIFLTLCILNVHVIYELYGEYLCSDLCLTGYYGNVFDFCAGRCRHNSASVVYFISCSIYDYIVKDCDKNSGKMD